MRNYNDNPLAATVYVYGRK